MRDRSPTRVMLVLVGVAAVALAGSGLLDHQDKWGDPRQAVANVLWMVFMASLLALVASAVWMVTSHRRMSPRH